MLCYRRSIQRWDGYTVYRLSSGAVSRAASTRAMKASSASSVWKWVACPDNT